MMGDRNEKGSFGSAGFTVVAQQNSWRARAVLGTPLFSSDLFGCSIHSRGCRKNSQKPTPSRSALLGTTSLDEVKLQMAGEAGVEFYPGLIPDTFRGLEDKLIAFAHIDVDQYATTKACCSFIFPRLVSGGIIVIDDYGVPSTFGSRLGADEYFREFGIKPVVLSTGQAMIVR